MSASFLRAAAFSGEAVLASFNFSVPMEKCQTAAAWF
jgi:hypothetical protein